MSTSAAFGAARRVVFLGVARSLNKGGGRPSVRWRLANDTGGGVRKTAAAAPRVVAPALVEEQEVNLPRFLESESPLLRDFDPPTRLLGRGGFATVIQARHRVDRREYALKLVDDDSHSDVQEVAIMRRVGSHEHIVPLCDAWFEEAAPKLTDLLKDATQDDDSSSSRSSSLEGDFEEEEPASSPPRWRLCIQLGLCPRGSLHDWLQARQDTCCSWAEEREIAVSICSGLRHVHASRCAHLDLSPRNVLRDREGKWRIADFGLATLSLNKQQGDLFGSPAYTAPERRRRTGGDARAADVFALGVITFELLTLFNSGMERALAVETLRADPKEALAQTRRRHGPRLAELVAKMTRENPRHRPTAQNVLDDLMHPDLLSGSSTITIQ